MMVLDKEADVEVNQEVDKEVTKVVEVDKELMFVFSLPWITFNARFFITIMISVIIGTYLTFVYFLDANVFWGIIFLGQNSANWHLVYFRMAFLVFRMMCLLFRTSYGLLVFA